MTDETTEVYLQWHGTDACLDFWCACGHRGHLDGYSNGVLQCPRCSAQYSIQVTVTPTTVRDDNATIVHAPFEDAP